MKKIMFFLVLFVFVAGQVFAQAQKPKYEPAGKWQFEAPYAPEGYNSGTMEFVKAEGKYQAFITFTGSDYKIPLERVTVRNDSIYLYLYVEGTDVPIRLRMENEEKISGVALSPDGDIPLSSKKVKQ